VRIMATATRQMANRRVMASSTGGGKPRWLRRLSRHLSAYLPISMLHSCAPGEVQKQRNAQNDKSPHKYDMPFRSQAPSSQDDIIKPACDRRDKGARGAVWIGICKEQANRKTNDAENWRHQNSLQTKLTSFDYDHRKDSNNPSRETEPASRLK